MMPIQRCLVRRVRTLCCLLLLCASTAAEASELAYGFILERAGTLTTTPTETLSGQRSIRGAASSGAYTPFLKTDPNKVLLGQGKTYQVRFRYVIVEAQDRGFEVLFYSPTAGARGDFLQSSTLSGAPGSAGIATLTSTLRNYTDYELRWNIVGRGAIVIDEIRVTEERTGELITAEDAEGRSSLLRLGQAFLPTAKVGRPYAASLVAINGRAPYTWKVGVIGAPPGFQLSTEGFLSGSPTTAGTFAFDAVVSDGSSSIRLPIRVDVVVPSAVPAPQPLSTADGTATVRPRAYAGAFRNPLGGMRPYVPQAAVHPFASLARQYVEWNLLEHSEADTVERIREVTDRLFGDLPSLNVKAVPRVYLLWPDRGKYWPADLTPDDYTSAEFRARMKRLIARLGEVWNNDSRIAFIEMGFIGRWGEHHHPSFPTSGIVDPVPADMERELGDAFLEAFPDKLVMNRYPRNFASYPFGIHWDVFGSFDLGFWGNDTSGMIAELEKPPHRDRWKTAPRGGEIDPKFLGESEFSVATLRSVVRQHWTRLIETIRRLHWNHLDVLPALDQSDAELWEKASQIQNALGYRFVIQEVAYPVVLQGAQELQIRMQVRNEGSSPFYYNWPVEVALLNAADRRPVWRTTWDGLDIRNWLPGTDSMLTGTFSPGVPAGQYVLTVAILDPAGMVPAARFANVNYWAGGRTPIGPLSVGGPAPQFELNDFDDIHQDRSLFYIK